MRYEQEAGKHVFSGKYETTDIIYIYSAINMFFVLVYSTVCNRSRSN